MATTTAGLTVTPLHSGFAAEISGIDITRPLDDATFERVAVAFDDYSVLVFRGQALTDEQQMVFSERWGPRWGDGRLRGWRGGWRSRRRGTARDQQAEQCSQ
jgi:alpha-ketoglutarate-dependent 2,4-dichlorophenoxyacetate dioxygenase